MRTLLEDCCLNPPFANNKGDIVTAEELMKEQAWFSAHARALPFSLHRKPAVAGGEVGGKRK